MMIKFPEFKPLELVDWPTVKQITARFLPYSDYNFVSMWAWDTQGNMRLSDLNGNLVVRFTDYVTGEPFYSFIGDAKVNETAEILLELSTREGYGNKLKLIPQDTANKLDSDKFIITEDRNQFDYIYHINKIQTYSGNKYSSHRNLVNSFTKKHNFEVHELNLVEKNNHTILSTLLDKWVANKKSKMDIKLTESELEESSNEYTALHRLFTSPEEILNRLICFAVFVDGELCGFMIDEMVSKDYCVSHFGKTDIQRKGCMQFMMQCSARKFYALGVKYYNDEQDLGLPNLRSTKSSYELSHFLKKFTITLR